MVLKRGPPLQHPQRERDRIFPGCPVDACRVCHSHPAGLIGFRLETAMGLGT